MDKFINFRLDFDVKAIKVQLAKYFDDQHEEIHKVIESEITPEKILRELKRVIDSELPKMIRSAVELSVIDTVRYNKDLRGKIEKEVTKVVKKMK